MALVLNTNIYALNAQRRLAKTTLALHESFARLSSGLRINSAKDDAAGLAISNRFTAQIRGLNQSARNASDGISLLQVAEGSLEETTAALQRMRELAVQAANDTYTSSDRANLQDEVTQLIDEINRIQSTTQFNGQNLLDGNFARKKLQVGAYDDQNISVTLGSAGASAIGADVSIGTQSAANSAIDAIDAALDSISSLRSYLGAMQNRFESVINNLNNQAENISAAQSRILDADIAAEAAKLTRNSILQQAGTAILAQANQQPQLLLQLLGG
jgi:flagellin